MFGEVNTNHCSEMCQTWIGRGTMASTYQGLITESSTVAPQASQGSCYLMMDTLLALPIQFHYSPSTASSKVNSLILPTSNGQSILLRRSTDPCLRSQPKPQVYLRIGPTRSRRYLPPHHLRLSIPPSIAAQYQLRLLYPRTRGSGGSKVICRVIGCGGFAV